MQSRIPTTVAWQTARSGSPPARDNTPSQFPGNSSGNKANRPMEDKVTDRQEREPRLSPGAGGLLSAPRALRPGRFAPNPSAPRGPTPLLEIRKESPRPLQRHYSPSPDEVRGDRAKSFDAFHQDLKEGSAVPIRKDRESVLKAIAAQFQGSDPELRCLSPAPGRPVAASNSLEFYAVGKLLGKGAFGKVNVGVHKLTEEIVALKLCERRRITEVGAKKCLMQEVGLIKRLTGHPNIIQLFEVVETATQIVLVMEFASGGDLLRFVRQRRRLAEPTTKDLFKQIMDGLSHIHAMSVVHRDIKLENLLLDSFGCVKIADFGVAMVMQPGKRLHEHCGTPSYIAPEILMEAGYEGEPVDVWSSGIVLYAMLCGRVPFKGEHLSDLKRCILRGRFHFPPHLSQPACAIINSMLILEPRRRATVPEVIGHRFLEGIENRAEMLYSHMLRSQPPEEGMPEGRLVLPPGDSAARALLEKVSEFGFPVASLEESLSEGKFDHATATFHLLSQQVTRKQAAALAPSGPPGSGAAVRGTSHPPAGEDHEDEDNDDDDGQLEGHLTTGKGGASLIDWQIRSPVSPVE